MAPKAQAGKRLDVPVPPPETDPFENVSGMRNCMCCICTAYSCHAWLVLSLECTCGSLVDGLEDRMGSTGSKHAY
eukprot:1161263-Pelagomonas_calceolata.AAC.5